MSSSQKFIRKKIPTRSLSLRGSNPYFPKEHLSLLQRYWETILSIFLVLVALIYWLFFSGYFNINDIVVTGNENITNEQLLTTFREIQDSNRFFILPQNNVLFFSEERAMNYMQESYVLDELHVTKNYPSTISITLKERIPGMIYRNGDQQFYTDRKGVVTGIVQEGEQDERFPLIIDLNEHTVHVREHVLSEQATEFFLQLIDAFPKTTPLTPVNGEVLKLSCSKPTTIEEEIILAPEDNEETEEDSTDTKEPETKIIEKIVEQDIDCNTLKTEHQIALATKEGVHLYFTTLDDITLQLEHLDILITQQLDRNVSDLDYIDLRFGNKIYYK